MTRGALEPCPQQEEPPPREVLAQATREGPHLPHLEKCPRSSEDPAQPELSEWVDEIVFKSWKIEAILTQSKYELF